MGGLGETRWRGWFCIAAVVLENLSRFSHEGFCSMVTEFLILFFLHEGVASRVKDKDVKKNNRGYSK